MIVAATVGIICYRGHRKGMHNNNLRLTTQVARIHMCTKCYLCQPSPSFIANASVQYTDQVRAKQLNLY